MAATDPQPPPPPVVMRDLLAGYWKSQCLYVAARLGLADLEGKRRADGEPDTTPPPVWAL